MLLDAILENIHSFVLENKNKNLYKTKPLNETFLPDMTTSDLVFTVGVCKTNVVAGVFFIFANLTIYTVT